MLGLIHDERRVTIGAGFEVACSTGFQARSLDELVAARTDAATALCRDRSDYHPRPSALDREKGLGTMMTVITRIDLEPGIAAEWDDTMRERLQAAETAPGWIAGQILAPRKKPALV